VVAGQSGRDWNSVSPMLGKQDRGDHPPCLLGGLAGAGWPCEPLKRAAKGGHFLLLIYAWQRALVGMREPVHAATAFMRHLPWF
jgi:hypothetical protein